MTLFIHHVCYLAGRENIDLIVLEAGEIKLIHWKKLLARNQNTFCSFYYFDNMHLLTVAHVTPFFCKKILDVRYVTALWVYFSCGNKAQIFLFAYLYF
jgi:hypothetical protein